METFRRCILAVLLILPSLLFAGEAININTADKETLMSITGIGERRADAIIAYRDQHGPFKSIDQLAEIKGVGQALVEKNRDSLVVKE
ncbi:MAG: ComEA family DNA-binding protein [Gammaproteobacteria bacterium]|nr:ComEA family DNA-binding protein [Gammaproteobacteria bacterium]